MAPGRSWTNRKQPADQHVTDHFRKKSLFFRDTRDHPEHDAKNRLSLPSPSPEKPLAEIHQLKKNRPKVSFFLTDIISARGFSELVAGIDKRFFVSCSWWSLVSRKNNDFFRKWSIT